MFAPGAKEKAKTKGKSKAKGVVAHEILAKPGALTLKVKAEKAKHQFPL
jgi:hypothetical protein